MYQRKRIRGLFFLLILICSTAKAGPKTEAMIAQLDTTRDNSKRLELLIEIGRNKKYNDPEGAMNYARQTLELSREIDDKYYEVRALLQMQDIYFGLQNLNSAFRYALAAKDLVYQENIEEQMGNLHNAIGNIWYVRDSLDLARENYEISIKYRRKTHPQAVAGNLNNIGKILIKQGKGEEAKTLFKEARQINDEYENWYWKSINLLNLGEVELMANRPSSGKEYLLEGYELSKKNNYVQSVDEFLLQLVHWESKYGSPQKARDLLTPLLQSDLETYHYKTEEAYELSASLYERSGNFNAAYKDLEFSKMISDSLARLSTREQLETTELSRKLESIELQHEFSRQQEEQAKEEELKRVRLTSLLYLFGLLIVVIIAIFIFLRYRANRRLSKSLSLLIHERTGELSEAHGDLQNFVYRSSHDLRGPIRSIKGLQNLLLKEPGRDLVEMIGQKITQLDMAQRNLEYAMELRTRATKSSEVDLGNLVETKFELLESEYGNGVIDLTYEETSDLTFESDQWIIGMIVEHLLENAIVFRNLEGKASCNFKAQIVDGKVIFQVKDNGIGMGPEVLASATNMFFRGSNRSKGNGLGLNNVERGVEKLGGVLEIESHPKRGTMVTVELPLDKAPVN